MSMLAQSVCPRGGGEGGGWAVQVTARVEQWLATPWASCSRLHSWGCPVFEQAFRKGTLESLEMRQDGWCGAWHVRASGGLTDRSAAALV